MPHCMLILGVKSLLLPYCDCWWAGGPVRGSYIPCNVLISNIFQVWLRLCEVWPWLLTPCCQFRRNRKACFLMRLFGVYCSAGFYNRVNIDLAYLNNYLKRLSTFIESLKAFYPKFACELNLLHSYAFKSFVKKFVILSFKFWVVSKSTIIFYIYIYIYILVVGRYRR